MTRHTARSWFVEKIIRPRWIVNEGGEMGVRILGVNAYYYKRYTPLFYGKEDPDPRWRYSWHREFGECVISRYKDELP